MVGVTVREAVGRVMDTDARYGSRVMCFVDNGRWNLTHMVSSMVGHKVSPESVARRHRELLKERGA